MLLCIRMDKMDKTGSSTLYIGPMFANKTSMMVHDTERYDLAMKYKGKCLIVKYLADTRYDHITKFGGIVTHRGDERSKIPVVRVNRLADVDTTGKLVIGIDEGQFYPDAPEFIEEWATSGIKVICACLDSTWEYKPFGRVHEIIAQSENVHKLKAVCMTCGADASWTKRINTTNKSIEDIGGSDKYLAVCRNCR